MKSRGGYPVELLGRMVHGVILPQPRLVETPVYPVHHEIGGDEKENCLQPQRQVGKRSVTVVVEIDQPLRRGDIEQERSPEHQKADAQVSRKQGDKEPVAKVGQKLALAPPWPARVAGPEERQGGEGGGQCDGYRNDL